MEPLIITSQYGNIAISWPSVLVILGITVPIAVLFITLLVWSIATGGKFDN